MLLAIALAGCGQKKVVVNHEPTVKSYSSSSSHYAVAEKSSSSEKAAESKPEEVEQFTDSRDGKKYKTVKIGTKIWMAKNLNYNANGSKCYNNQPANCDKYGRLYNWGAAKSVCPKGWHLPSNNEWDELYRFADGTSGTESLYISKTAGKYLKSANGFSAQLGGIGYYGDKFDNAGLGGFWWSADEYDHDSYAYNRHVVSADNVAYWSYNDKSSLFSVRCLKN
ncbi:MAG: fibrobacter succinogenes major paralogous domain-containing protein [Fibromonadales bacterium]|nr:fibrobacter succinogenes major paralogous domain-containing protein [Fibromonadales bacterium]